MTNKRFIVFVAIMAIAGFALGWLLASNPTLKLHKVLFVIGSIYNLLAVVVLSEAFSRVGRYKEIALGILAPAILWIHTIIPIAAALGAIASGYVVHAPGSAAAARFAFAVFLYSLLPLGLFDEIVVFPRKRIFADMESRWRFFGLFLVASGVLLQLIASLIDLNY